MALVGFRGLTQFVRIVDQEAAGLVWLQSVTAPETAFALVAPPLAASEYRLDLRPG